MPTPPETVKRLRIQTSLRRAIERHALAPHSNPPQPAGVAPPCVLVGPELTGIQRQEPGLPHSKRWQFCTHPDHPIGEVVCPCLGCGPKCKGYSAESEAAEEKSPQPILQQLTWQYGVTTVPSRRDELLPRTLLQLKKAGFEKPHLFVDGSDDSVSWSREFDLEVTCRSPKIRAFGNWMLSLCELYLRNPDADRYAIFQDDFLTYRNLRAYLDNSPYPAGGYLNLFTFMGNEKLAPGHDTPSPRVGWYKSNQYGRGAVALVFDGPAVDTLMRGPAAAYLWERVRNKDRGHRAIDGGVVEAMKKVGYAEYVHHPSLVQHLGGHPSAIGNRHHPDSKNFKGENFDALELLAGL